MRQTNALLNQTARHTDTERERERELMRYVPVGSREKRETEKEDKKGRRILKCKNKIITLHML